MAREKEQTLSMDAGAQLSDAVSVVSQPGAIAEDAWPYHEGQFKDHSPSDVEKAKHYRASTTRRLNNLAEIRAALAKGPVVIGIAVYLSFQSNTVTKTGVVPMPAPDEFLLGGHALCIVGYDDQKKRVKFENSWGPEWGDHGYGYLSYEYVAKYLSTDNWALSF